MFINFNKFSQKIIKKIKIINKMKWNKLIKHIFVLNQNQFWQNRFNPLLNLFRLPHSKSTLKISQSLVANLPLALPVNARLVYGLRAYLKLL